MKLYVIFSLLAASLCAAQSNEYLRPTADANSTADLSSYLFCFNTGISTSTSLSTVYTGKSGAGPTGSGNTQTATYSGSASYNQRIFSSWQTTTRTYTSLTLNLSLAVPALPGTVDAGYSLDGGSTWVEITPAGTTQTTYTATITGANLANLQVATCAEAIGTRASPATIAVYDIWTTGVVSNAQPGVQVIGHLEPPQRPLRSLKWNRLERSFLAADVAVRALDAFSTRRILAARCRCNHEMFLPGFIANHTAALTAFEGGMLAINYEVSRRLCAHGRHRRALALMVMDVAVVAPWAIRNLFLRN